MWFCAVLTRIGTVAINVNEAVLEDHREYWQDRADTNLQEIWSSLKSHKKLFQQAGAIQDMLRSSVEPPDIST
jgi:hypothetical protein